MTLQGLAEFGYTCGLDTFGEAALDVARHWDAFPERELIELNQQIEQAPEYDIGFDMLCVHFLGAERCAQLDAELDAVLEAQQAIASESPDDEVAFP